MIRSEDGIFQDSDLEVENGVQALLLDKWYIETENESGFLITLKVY